VVKDKGSGAFRGNRARPCDGDLRREEGSSDLIPNIFRNKAFPEKFDLQSKASHPLAVKLRRSRPSIFRVVKYRRSGPRNASSARFMSRPELRNSISRLFVAQLRRMSLSA